MESLLAVGIGLMTPPFSLVIFSIRSILVEQEINLNNIFIGVLAFEGIMLTVLPLLVYFPRFARAPS